MCTIVEFTTQVGAEAALAEYDEAARKMLIAMGYRTDAEGNILGKNHKTGVSVPSAKTTTWDQVKESPEATFYFRSPRSQGPQSEAIVQAWVDAGSCVEKAIPPEWIPEDPEAPGA